MSGEPDGRDRKQWGWATTSVALGTVCVAIFVATRDGSALLPDWALASLLLGGFTLLLAGYVKILRVARASRKRQSSGVR